MTAITSFRSDATPSINSGVMHVQKVLSVVNGSAANADTINVMGIAPSQKLRLVSGHVRVSGTLGASCTVQLRAAGTAVSTATTAGAAGKVDTASNINVPMDLNGGDLIDLLVAGAGITASANITVDLLFAVRQ